MFKKMVTVPLMVLAVSSSLTYAAEKSRYNPDLLSLFNETNKCIGCDLTEANFMWTNHDNADLSSTLLSKAIFSWAAFNNANFSNAVLTKAEMNHFHGSSSNYRGANLSSANLVGANLANSDFTGADLHGANLADANLLHATMTDIQLYTAKSLSCAIMPDGSIHDDANGKPCEKKR